jgi:DNA-binding NtrC family response regulator
MLIDQVKLELPASGADVNTHTLLLVDDDARILAALKRVLRRDGYSILTASSAAEALELLACNTVAVVVTDQRMPEMTGVEFLRRVKDLYPDAVRIMLSGYTDFQSITDAINRGAVYKFLTKPWDDKHLRAIVREAFRRNALAGEGGPSQRKALAAGTVDEPQQPPPDPASHSQGEL